MIPDLATLSQILIICTPINIACALLQWYRGNRKFAYACTFNAALCLGCITAIKFFQ